MAYKKVGLGEYDSFFIGTDNQIYDTTSGTSTKIAGQPANVVDVQGGLHTHGLITSDGSAYGWGDNLSQWAGVNSANPINSPIKFASGVKQIVPFFAAGEGFALIKTDGTLWTIGNTTQGLSGTGAGGSAKTSAPVQVKFPSGTVIVDVWVNGAAFALDSIGNVYSWGYSGGQNASIVLSQGTNSPVSNTPTKVPLPGPAKAICSHSWGTHILLQNGQLYACGQDYRYYGYALGQLSSLPIAPIRVDTLYKLPAPIVQITANYMSTFAILADGSMWAWGENTSGTIGNGQETNMKATNPTYSAPWYNSPAWNLSSTQGGALFVQFPVQIGKGIQWANLKRGTCYVMYMFAEDINGNLYSWGRNKGYVLANGIGGNSNLQASQPNLWDVTSPTKVQPFGAVVTPPVDQTPLAVISQVQPVTLPNNIITLDGSGSIDPDGSISSYAWTAVNGPTSAILGLGSKVQVLLSSSGTYNYQLTVTDNQGATNSAQVSVSVSPVPVCPPIPAPRIVTGVQLTIFGNNISIPLSSTTFTFSDGSTQ